MSLRIESLHSRHKLSIRPFAEGATLVGWHKCSYAGRAGQNGGSNRVPSSKILDEGHDERDLNSRSTAVRKAV